jgi:hypothetical protein
MTDLTSSTGTWRRRLTLGLQIGLGSVLVGLVVWFLAGLFLTRYVAASLAIAMIYGAQSVLEGTLARRETWRQSLFPAVVIVPLLWWLGWLALTNSQRHQ